MDHQPTPRALCIASTFTAEPAEEGLRFWLKQLGIAANIVFAPYGQLFQSLLDPSSELGKNRHGANVLFIRWRDLTQSTPAPLDELAAALRKSCERTAIPHIVITGPAEPNSGCDETALDAALSEKLSPSSPTGTPLAYLITGQAVVDRYPVAEIYDADADRVGHVPYTEVFYAGLATTVVRALNSLWSPPRKVIVLDCDNTLWDGVVGEEGADGVGVSGPFAALQSICVQHAAQGKLLCLASKNVEDDVWSVFDRRDMPLRREHITAHRINWHAKSQNLRALAKELSLGLDSFVFVDDSPVECAEVRAACPEVLTVELPKDASVRPRMLQHLWALDQLRLTSDDHKRAQTYKDNAARSQMRTTAGSLSAFLQQLELVIDIAVAGPEDVPRIAQLSQRTNQFNATTVRRDEGQVRALLERAGPPGPGSSLCRVVRVRDRFGDYGLVGVMIATCQEHALEVDSLMLSCRALGRGVEHSMLVHLGQFATQHGLADVRVPLLPTPRNEPIRAFLASLPAAVRTAHEGASDGSWFTLAAQDAAAVVMAFEDAPEPHAGPADGVATSPASADTGPATTADHDILLEIATRYATAQAVLTAIVAGRQRRRDLAGYASPRPGLERDLATIWQEVLGIDRVGVRDRFSDLGGESLQLVRIHSLIVKRLGIDVDLTALFSHSTIESQVQLFTDRNEGNRMAAVRPRADAQRRRYAAMESIASRLRATRRGASRQ